MPEPLHPEGGARSIVGTAALLAVPVLCCAGPALLGAAALGTVGSWLLSPWLIGAAGLLALGVVGWQPRRPRELLRPSGVLPTRAAPSRPVRRPRPVDRPGRDC